MKPEILKTWYNITNTPLTAYAQFFADYPNFLENMKQCQIHKNLCEKCSSSEGSWSAVCFESYDKTGSGEISAAKCINRLSICDGKVDCPNAEDESQCPGHNLGTNNSSHRNFELLPIVKVEHTATMKRCKTEGEVCDGRTDCEDGSDERDCPLITTEQCSRYHFVPGFGREVSGLVTRCNGIFDCPGREDEEECEGCINNAYHCYLNNTCITSIQRCDGVKDCEQGEDEVNCSFEGKTMS
ncbi:low-density lipoprotein receptor domain class A domain-containing protein [Ditylenchus destructor]|nr:low-density lipoprotein receptor domain class A domain-containing protein [Ditylenchus destructor]